MTYDPRLPSLALVLILLTPWLGGLLAEPVTAQRYPKLTPYSAIRWTAEQACEARIGDTWHIALGLSSALEAR